MLELFHGIPDGIENRMIELADLYGEAMVLYGEQIEVLSGQLGTMALWEGPGGGRAAMDALQGEIKRCRSGLSMTDDMRDLTASTAMGIEIAKWIA